MLEVKGYDQLNEILWNNKDNGKILMLYFGTSWCGPCQKLKEKIVEEKESIESLLPIHLDCDEEDNEKIVEDWKIDCLPTQIFVHLENNSVLKDKRIEGYDWIQLKMTYDEIIEKKSN